MTLTMTSAGGLVGFFIIAILTLHNAGLGDTNVISLNEPDVPFPPACPTVHNLAAICHSGHGRPRYPPNFFPGSRFSHFRRRGSAINRLESWFSLCCSGQVARQSHLILCCTRQAWKQALSQFCDEEYSTMTLPYECCAERGEARWMCFDSELPNPNYSATPDYTPPQVPDEPGFSFDSNAC